jgi:hypothetical protein
VFDFGDGMHSDEGYRRIAKTIDISEL